MFHVSCRLSTATAVALNVLVGKLHPSRREKNSVHSLRTAQLASLIVANGEVATENHARSRLCAVLSRERSVQIVKALRHHTDALVVAPFIGTGPTILLQARLQKSTNQLVLEAFALGFVAQNTAKLRTGQSRLGSDIGRE